MIVIIILINLECRVLTIRSQCLPQPHIPSGTLTLTKVSWFTQPADYAAWLYADNYSTIMSEKFHRHLKISVIYYQISPSQNLTFLEWNIDMIWKKFNSQKIIPNLGETISWQWIYIILITYMYNERSMIRSYINLLQ